MNKEQFKAKRIIALNLTQRELAEELGITQASVSRIETGARKASKRLIKAFSLLIESKRGNII